MVDRDNAYLTDLLQSIADRSRRWFSRNFDYAASTGTTPELLAQALLSTRGEASGVALARVIVDRWDHMNKDERLNWFSMLADDFGPSVSTLQAAVDAWMADHSPITASKLHAAAEPRRQELLRRINLAPNGTATLVKMREFLLLHINGDPGLNAVDADFAHLFGSWFNRGFLLLHRIDWSSPADILERIIRYEAVHEIRNWNDLRGRLKPVDRRCFAFFHPQMPDEPLIFVEVALTKGMPAEIGGLLAEDRTALADSEADTAVFYSISNTQAGLKGISFGNFLIKQVVEELLRELPGLRTFVTLSPIPGFAVWLAGQVKPSSDNEPAKIDGALLAALSEPGWHMNPETRDHVQPALERAAATYLLKAKSGGGKPADPVARFHLHNGARLERINYCGDISTKGLKQSHGMMVNYLYDLDLIEQNHELYSNACEVAASGTVRKLLSADNQTSLTRNIQSLLRTKKELPK